MSIVLAILIGIVGGFMFAAVWKSEEIEALTRTNTRLIMERDQARAQLHPFTPTQQRMSVVH